MKSVKYPLVQIEWLDHSNIGGWEDVISIESIPIPKVISVGYIIAEDKDRVILSSTLYELNGDPQTCQTMFILKKCITKRKKIK